MPTKKRPEKKRDPDEWKQWLWKCGRCYTIRTPLEGYCPECGSPEFELLPNTQADCSVTFDDDRMSLRFTQFSPADYQMFLRAKALPEYEVVFNNDDESYTITAPARFAGMLGIEAAAVDRAELELSDFLWDDQTAITRMALAAKRFACWSDCGLGKTIIGLEWARHVTHRTGRPVLIFTLNEIVDQWIDEARSFYGDGLEVLRLESRQDMRRWAAGEIDGPPLAITNYEKMNPDESGQVVNELRNMGGVVLDESDRLKGGGGKQKWALIKSCKGIEYKLSLTATPAPNDTMEFASQASFLEKMRTDADIIWTYFHRDPKSHRWTVKRHAREAFFRFMASWSIYVRDPRRFGWRKDHPDVPTPVIQLHEIGLTEGQRQEIHRSEDGADSQMLMFRSRDANAIERGKMSQVAKGFRYLKGEAAGKYRLIDSKKPRYVADLIRKEMKAGLQGIVWTVFDAEAELLLEACAKLKRIGILTGKTKPEDRRQILKDFKRGKIKWLISRASMLGYGMNFQHVGAMIFSGWNDSYVAYYQAVRRAVRTGQTRNVRVHIPVIPELEMDMLENIFSKEARNLADIEEMEHNYIAAMKEIAA